MKNKLCLKKSMHVLILTCKPQSQHFPHLDGPKLVISPRVIVDYGDKVVANVQLLIAAGGVSHEICRHPRGNVEYHLGDVVMVAVGKVPISP